MAVMFILLDSLQCFFFFFFSKRTYHLLTFGQPSSFCVICCSLDFALWILDIFQNRTQVVKINNTFSSFKVISVGSDKDVLLSPLLYSVYTNDVFHIVNQCTF